MPPDTLLLHVIGRAASVRADSIDVVARTVEIVWTTGATVQRRRWEGWDEIREYDEELIVTPTAVRLERMNGGAPFLASHDGWSLRSVLGAIEPGSVRIEGGQGVATIRLTSAPDAADTVHRILEKTVRHVSVGYRVHRYEITKREGQRELWRAVDWEPMEVSAVAMPADPGAHIRAAGVAAPDLTPCTLTRSDTPAAHAAHHKEAAMPNDTLPPGSEPDATRSLPPSPAPVLPAPPAPSADTIRAEERQRAAEITTLCQRHGLGLDFGADLIDRGVALDAARSAILDRLVAQNPTTRGAEITPARVGGPSSTDLGFRDAVTEALLHRHEPGRTPLSADAREFRGLTLMEMARIAVERRGINTRGMSKMELATEALMGRASVGYHATADFPFLLANVANKTLRSAYESTPRTFTAWARQATITDFRQVQRTQLGGAPDLQRVPESGEFTYGTIGKGREVYSLLTYGRIVGITRQTLINEDLDAFTRVPSAFGGVRRRSRKRSGLFDPDDKPADGRRSRALRCRSWQSRHGGRHPGSKVWCRGQPDTAILAYRRNRSEMPGRNAVHPQIKDVGTRVMSAARAASQSTSVSGPGIATACSRYICAASQRAAEGAESAKNG
jgi:HK97 family phage prohead protease